MGTCHRGEEVKEVVEEVEEMKKSCVRVKSLGHDCRIYLFNCAVDRNGRSSSNVFSCEV